MRCDGVLVPTDELLDLVRQMAPDLHPDEALPITPRKSAGPLACPLDSAQLVPGRLGTIAIDHCEHGVWFDGEELQRALEAIGLDFAKREAERVPGARKHAPPPQWRPSQDRESFGEMLANLVRWALRRDDKLEP